MQPTDAALETEHGFAIDPFAAAPHEASRIAGLGGTSPASEPGYAFRTMPLLLAPGAAEFCLRFDDLRADSGRINIDLTATPAAEGSAPVTVRTMVVPLADVIAAGGTVAVPVEPRRDMLYAVAGYLHDDAAAAARSLSVEIVTGAARTPVAASAQPVAVPRLTSIDDPDFGNPVSQPITAADRHHPDYRRWADVLRSAGSRGDDSPPRAFVLQAFDRYGMLRNGAGVLALGAPDPTLQSCIVAAGCRLIDEGEAADVAWSIDLAVDDTSLRDRVWRGIHAVVPGGLGVHVFTLDDRAMVERLALDVVSFGHEVTQLKFRVSGRPIIGSCPTPYGLIVRCGGNV